MIKYLKIFFAIFILGAIGSEIYFQMTKDKIPGKAKRIPCHQNITAFEKSYNKTKILEAKELLKSGNFKITSGVDKSTHMQSSLFDFVDMKKLDTQLLEQLNKNISTKKLQDKKVTVAYKVYENDKEDPKKKSDNCKLYRGYVVLKVTLDNKTLYQVQIDFMDYKGKDVPQTLSCALESFLTY